MALYYPISYRRNVCHSCKLISSQIQMILLYMMTSACRGSVFVWKMKGILEYWNILWYLRMASQYYIGLTVRLQAHDCRLASDLKTWSYTGGKWLTVPGAHQYIFLGLIMIYIHFVVRDSFDAHFTYIYFRHWNLPFKLIMDCSRLPRNQKQDQSITYSAR